MKTTPKFPDPVFRGAKARAATPTAEQAPFMKGFGQLRPLRRETARIQRVIQQEFDVVEILETADEFLRQRAGKAAPRDLLRYARKAAREAPADTDRR
jgi:hypothetical protein